MADTQQQKNGGQYRSILILVVTLVGMLALVWLLEKEMSKVRAFIQAAGWLGWLVSVLLYGLLGATPVPSEPFTVLVTSLFGPVSATAIATLGNLLAAEIEFFIGGRIGNAANFDKHRANLPLGLGKLPVDSPLFLILARMLPGYGPKGVSLISGMYRVSLWRYTWTAFVSTLAGALVVAFGGAGLLSLLHR